jgi:hypothetical protein
VGLSESALPLVATVVTLTMESSSLDQSTDSGESGLAVLPGTGISIGQGLFSARTDAGDRSIDLYGPPLTGAAVADKVPAILPGWERTILRVDEAWEELRRRIENEAEQAPSSQALPGQESHLVPPPSLDRHAPAFRSLASVNWGPKRISEHTDDHLTRAQSRATIDRALEQLAWFLEQPRSRANDKPPPNETKIAERGTPIDVALAVLALSAGWGWTTSRGRCSLAGLDSGAVPVRNPERTGGYRRLRRVFSWFSRYRQRLKSLAIPAQTP